MRRIDDIFPQLGFVPALILVIVFGVALELSGAWVTMLVAGALGALFVRKAKRAFLVGFLGVGIAWTLLFAYLVLTAHALEVANFFIGLLGASGLGALVIVISVIIGALLGGFGGLLGRTTIELIDGLISRPAQEKAPASE